MEHPISSMVSVHHYDWFQVTWPLEATPDAKIPENLAIGFCEVKQTDFSTIVSLVHNSLLTLSLYEFKLSFWFCLMTVFSINLTFICMPEKGCSSSISIWFNISRTHTYIAKVSLLLISDFYGSSLLA